MNLQIIVLAAGLDASERSAAFTETPQQHLRAVVAAATQAVEQAVAVILGRNAQAFDALFSRTPASLVVDRSGESSVTAAIRCGMRALPPACDAVLLISAETRLVAVSVLRQLIAAAQTQPGAIIGCRASIPGPPVVFPSWSFAELAQVAGSEGLAKLLNRYRDRVVTLPT
jgi:CTP:molybdopterin cytidylyltransferase MocA